MSCYFVEQLQLTPVLVEIQILTEIPANHYRWITYENRRRLRMDFHDVTHCIFDMDGLLLGKDLPSSDSLIMYIFNFVFYTCFLYYIKISSCITLQHDRLFLK